MNAVYAILRLAAWPGRRRRCQRALAFDPARARRIWVHKPDHLGDAVLARPALATLRAACPNAEIRVACDPAAASLLALDGAWHVEPWASPFLGGDGEWREYRRRVRAFAPDLLVNLRHDVRDILLCTALAPCLVSYDHRGVASSATHAGSPPADDRPEAENHVALLQDTLGLSAAALGPLPLPNEAVRRAAAAWGGVEGSGPKIVLHAAARTPAKLWPVSHWRELIKLLRAQHHARLALVGGAPDADLNQEIARDVSAVVNWAGRLSLVETTAAIATADLLIGIDSGPGHLARAVGTPVVSLMSGTNETRRWAPVAAHTLTFLVTCAPCHRESCHVDGHPCLSRIEPARVAVCVAEVLGV